jgi:Mg-chelatase subunit ChlD
MRSWFNKLWDTQGPEEEFDTKIQFDSATVDGEYLVNVTVKAPEATTRRPIDVIAVVDVSGSMGMDASVSDVENDGLSRLDLVKHSVNTIVAALKDEDQFALITFSNDAKVSTSPTKMDSRGREKATEHVKSLAAGGGTQLWKGLSAGIDVAAKLARPERTTAVMVLTDGCPSDSNHLEKLDSLLAAQPTLASRISVSTFGFGYQLSSKLLDDIAHRCGGLYTFVPDGTIVGTAFVNNLSNVMATAQQGLRLELEPGPGMEIDRVYGQFTRSTSDNVTTTAIGPLLYGQDRSIVVSLKKREHAAIVTPVAAEVTQTPAEPEQPNKTDSTSNSSGGDEGDGKKPNDASEDTSQGTNEGDKNEGDDNDKADKADKTLLRATVYMGSSVVSGRAPVSLLLSPNAKDTLAQKYRLEFGEVVAAQQALGAPGSTIADSVPLFLEAIKASAAAQHPHTLALCDDLEGQVSEAFSRRDWFTKWGTHYLPSLSRSHMLQQCTNFKDPGLQVYGGAIFAAARDECDDIFVSLPPPEPSNKRGHGGASAPVSMAAYYNCSGGCFAGDCSVAMHDRSLKRVDRLRRGDAVLSASGLPATVRCVVKQRCERGFAELVTLPGGAKLTSFHPVHVRGAWEFPSDLARVEKVPAKGIYNLVLESGHTAFINGVECVTLGHGFKDQGEVVHHDFFGSMPRIVEGLAQHPGWQSGHVELQEGAFVRSPITNEVCAIRPPGEL